MASWQSAVVTLLVRARMRPHAYKPIDPHWVREQMGRPRFARVWMARAAGAVSSLLPATGGWPGGEVVTSAAPARVSESAPTILYLHGGGFIACSPETHRPLVGSLLRRTGGRAFVPAYRLAPEHPAPAALEDAIASYTYLLESERVDPAHLVIAGDSAGGGLALALVVALRDRGAPLPAGLVLLSPWTDLAATGGSLDENTHRCAMFAGDTIRRAAPIYVGALDPRDPRVSPLFADLRGLPPMLIHACEDEVLRDDSTRLATWASAAGVPVSLRLWKRVPHVWQFFGAVLPEARQSLDDVAEFIATVTASAPRPMPANVTPQRRDPAV